jgi:peroxiredoxin
LDWSDKSGVPVLAVSDEDPATIRKFLDGWEARFPERVVSDDLRTVHVAYGVSGTPTFVLVDEQGKIQWRQVGYSASTGLTIPGWTWPGRAK